MASLSYVNPMAASWTTSIQVDPASCNFHSSLPGFSPTPLVDIPTLAKSLGVAHVLIKDESSRLGLPAFKILGASWATYKAISARLGLGQGTSLSEVAAVAQKAKVKLFAATDGNHGRAVAATAKWLGVEAHIYAPYDMVLDTQDLIRSEGSHVRLEVINGDYDQAVRAAFVASEASNGILIQDTAFEGYEEIPQWIIEGYSTIMTEVDEQVRISTGKDADIVIVPAGVGSLTQAVVLHYKSSTNRATVVAVEPDTAACVTTSLLAGRIVPITTRSTIMAGMCCGTVSSLAWPVIKEGLDASVSVSDLEAHRAVEDLRKLGVQIGPCGAATLAGLRLIAGSDRSMTGLSEDSVVILLGTEGTRSYAQPYGKRAFATERNREHIVRVA